MSKSIAKEAWPRTAARVNRAGQQQVLRDAMETLGLTRQEFAARIHVPIRTFDKWLLPDESTDHRQMPDMARGYIADLLRWHSSTRKS